MVPADQRDELRELVGLGVPTSVVKIEQLGNVITTTQVVTTSMTKLFEPECLCEPLHVAERDIPHTPRHETIKENSRLHAGNGRSDVCRAHRRWQMRSLLSWGGRPTFKPNDVGHRALVP